MLINAHKTCKNVKFISYTGRYPNLCRGVLTLEINGKEYKFSSWSSGEGDTFPRFWHSGGSCGFKHHYAQSFCTQDEWTIDVSKLPQELQKYASEIDEVFNSSVQFGCCGGCL